MAINTRAKAARQRVLAAERKGPQSSTHFPNDEQPDFEAESGYEVRNQQDPQELLYDPDEEGGNTHFRNDGQPGKDNTNVRASARRIEAPVRKTRATAAQQLLASDDEASGYTQDVNVEDDDATFGPADFGGADEVDANADEGPQATTHFPNGEPAGSEDAYLTIGDLTDLGPDSDAVSTPFDGGEEEGDEEFEGDEEVNASEEDEDWEEEEEEVNADALEDEAGQAPQQSLLDVTDEHEVDAEFDDAPVEPEGEPNIVEEEATELDAPNDGLDEMPIMDVDQMDDSADGLMTAAFGNVLHVVKANRIIASMTKKMAVKAGHADMYLSDEFHEAAVAECKNFGVRAGLKNMGFQLAKVNVAASAAVNKRVEARAKAVTASIRRTAQASNEALGQCLAIAAVGINRQYFKDTRNELRAALENELAAAGVRGASKLVRRVFASHGVDYAKAILMLANKLVSMPEETRNAFATALDMTSDGDFDADSDVEVDAEEGVDDAFGDEQSSDFQVEAGDEFESEFEEEEDAPETIHAALANPHIRRKSTVVSAKAANYSVQAQAILNGQASFGFGI